MKQQKKIRVPTSANMKKVLTNWQCCLTNEVVSAFSELNTQVLLRLAVLIALSCLPITAVAQGFTNVTNSSGITHVQTTAAVVAALPPLSRGAAFHTGGVATGDFDGDGHADLIFTRLGDTDIFYRNLGNGAFEQRTTGAGFTNATFTNGISAGDIDNDGDLDLYMTSSSDTRNFLYLNDGNGFFIDAGTSRAVALSNGIPRSGSGVSFGDYDNDGNLDLVTANWGSHTSLSQSRLFRNLGGTQTGFFEDVSVAAGIDTYRSEITYRFSPRLVDLDRDGHLDLTIASDFETSQLFWSNGDGTFTDDTLPSGVGTDYNGMGSTFGDYDGDGDLDWFITNITEDPDHPGGGGGLNRLYRNNGDRTFTNVTIAAGVQDSRWSWGTTFFDYDNDGDLDLIATNGWNGAGWVDDRTRLWRNDDGVFTDVSIALGITDTLQGRGLAHLDYDNDGDLDIVIVNNEAAPILYRNDTVTGNFLRLDVEGTYSNRDGVGAFITVTPDLSAPEESMVWEVDGGSSYLSLNEQIAHFGLGDHSSTVDQVSIQWPSGIVQKLFNLTANQTHDIVEADPDFDNDGDVDSLDRAFWEASFGVDATGDTNADTQTNGWDLLAWQRQYTGELSAGYSTSSQVPEPTSLVWILSATCLLHTRRKMRFR